MPPSLRFIPGNTVRWRARRFVVVDYASMDAIIARELGKRAFRRISIKEAVADLDVRFLITQTLQVGMLNGSFLLIFQGFIP
jgi:hypothetical protein